AGLLVADRRDAEPDVGVQHRLRARGGPWIHPEEADRGLDGRLRPDRVRTRVRGTRTRPTSFDLDRQRARREVDRQSRVVRGGMASAGRGTLGRFRRADALRAEREASALALSQLRLGARYRDLARRLR